MTMTQPTSWELGQLGESQFAGDLYRAIADGRLPASTTVFRNVLFGNGPGDIDFVVVGPLGVYVFDVKNWRTKPSRWQNLDRQADVTILETEFVYSQLEDALTALGIDVHMAWVMVGTQIGAYRIGSVPMLSVDQAIQVMSEQGTSLDENTTWRLTEYAKAKFTLVGGPEER